ncbi:MAG: alanine--glyoxylate aminotransferase family protein [Gemmatimonadota bacterium]
MLPQAGASPDPAPPPPREPPLALERRAGTQPTGPVASARPLHLFLTGPTYVRPAILQAMAQPIVGHRGPEFAALYREVRRKLVDYAGTSATPLLVPGSATALLEAGIRSLVPVRSLHAVCGAFGRRWEEVARLNGKETAVVEAPLGKPVRAELISRALGSGRFDAVCVTHSETSTGVLHDLVSIAAVMRRHPDVLFLVDAVSSFAAAPVDVDALGIDLLVTGTQKALALPPGMAIGFASARALDRARSARAAGWFLDLARIAEADAGGGTPTTPNIPLFYALDCQLGDLLREGAAERFARHRRMAAAAEAFCARAGLRVFPEPGYRSPAITVALTPGLDAERVRAVARERGWILGSGYAELKGRCFRIGHMGDHDEHELAELLDVLDEVLAELRA